MQRRWVGAATLEAAILTPLCIFLVTGTIDFGRWLQTKILVSRITYEAVRYASVQTGLEDPLSGSKAAIATRVDMLLKESEFISARTLSIDDTTEGGKNTVKVSLAVPFRSFLLWEVLGSVHATAEAPYLYLRNVAGEEYSGGYGAE